MRRENFGVSSPSETIKESFIVIDKSTNQALYGLLGKTLIFNTFEEGDNFGKQICNSYIVTKVRY